MEQIKKVEKVKKGQGMYQKCKSLWEKCFADTKRYMTFYFKDKTKKNQILTICEGNDLVSMLHLNPYKVNVYGKVIDTNYIVGVATEKDYRKKGYMRHLLSEAMKQMYEGKQPFTYLMPADKKIYEPFGFCFIYEQERIQGNHFKEENKCKNTGEVIPMLALSEEKREMVLSFITTKLREENFIFCERTWEYYELFIREMKAANGDVFVLYDMGQIIGVCCYMLEAGNLEIVEAIIEKKYTKRALSLLLEAIMEREREISCICFLESRFLEAGQLEELFEEVERKITPIIMGRIIHFPKFIEMLFQGKKDNKTSYIVKIIDSCIKQNNKTFELVKKEGKWYAFETEKEAEEVYRIQDFMKEISMTHTFYFNEIT